ncbi:MAG: FAD-binding oxidoreductase, partial [Vicinamibacteria bacterium]|nr:FAD-binding oxidoreductase [Vicinamibacteria bacterium]
MTPDAVVVGAGIVGAACAEALAAAGLRVHVIEAAIPGGGTTAAAMGHLVAMDDSPAQLALTRASLRLWRERWDALPADVERDACGTLWVAADEDEQAHVRTKAAAYAAAGLDAEVLDAAALREAEPALRPGLAGALRVPGDAVLYPPNAARALLDSARRHGATVATGVEATALKPGVVETSRGPIACDFAVNAAGATAPALSPGLPVVPRKGHLAITDRAPGLVRHQLVELGYLKSAHTMSAESVAMNVQPRATGQLLIGSSRELVGFAPEVDRGLLGRMLARATDYLPALRALPVIRVWTGFRPATA